MTQRLKSIIGITWKVGLGLFGIAAVVIGILIAETWYENSYGRAYWKDKTLSPDIVVRSFNNGRVRVWSKKTGRYITPKLMWVSGCPIRDSITVYCDVDGNRGYINCNTGAVVIDSKKVGYRHAWQFSEGRAFVVLPGYDSLSVIDHSGRIIVRNVAPFDKSYDYVYIDGVCKICFDDRCGLLSTDGTWVVRPEFFSIQTPNTFGYRIARNEHGYWLIDKDMKLVFDEPCEGIDYAIGHEEGEGTLYITRNHKKQLINYDGSIVEPFVIDGTYDLSYIIRYNSDDTSDYELVTDIVVYRVNGWEGLMNKQNGKIITPAIYTNFKMISKDLVRAELSMSYGDESVVMDKNGRVIK